MRACHPPGIGPGDASVEICFSATTMFFLSVVGRSLSRLLSTRQT